MEGLLILGGVVVSALVEVFKRYFGTNRAITLLAVAVFCFVGASLFHFLQYFGFLESFLQIAITAGAVYAFVIRNVPALK